MFKMLNYIMCVIFCLHIFLYRDVNTKCSGKWPVKANLNYKSFGKYFSFISYTPNVRDMLKGSDKVFKGPAGRDVEVTIKGMLSGKYFNTYKQHFQKAGFAFVSLFLSVSIL